MNKKGFTLIELLAVIVILAIIALIAVPIVLNIINNAQESSNERSVELYGKAVENAIGRYQTLYPEDSEITVTDITPYIEYKGDVECDNLGINENGTVYLSGCKVNDKDVSYTYGKKKVTQVFKPQYYSWYLSGTINKLAAPKNLSEVPPEGKQFYLGYDVSNGNVSEAYTCFIRNDTEYCLNGKAYDKNVEILNDAFADVENACFLSNGSYICSDGSLDAYASFDGRIAVNDDDMICTVYSSGTFYCDEDYGSGGQLT